MKRLVLSSILAASVMATAAFAAAPSMGNGGMDATPNGTVAKATSVLSLVASNMLEKVILVQTMDNVSDAASAKAQVKQEVMDTLRDAGATQVTYDATTKVYSTVVMNNMGDRKVVPCKAAAGQASDDQQEKRVFIICAQTASLDKVTDKLSAGIACTAHGSTTTVTENEV